MHDLKKRMLSTAAMVPLAMGVTIGAGALLAGTTVNPDVAVAACNPCAAKKACGACNPCAAKKACGACNPCAAKKACGACNPCAANACNPCNPCNPCAAGGSNASANCFVPRIQKAAACNPCAAKKTCGACNPCAAKKACGACNPCAAKKACGACNPCAAKKACGACNPCAAKKACGACNPCAAKKACGACNPCAAKKACGACNPCAAKKACSPCNPCAAKNPCAAANACNPCNPCNPCAAGAAIEVSNEEAAAVYGCLKKEMKVAYRKARDLYGNRYQDYKLFNKTPYVSATHGGRIVNNYANKFAAKVYGNMEKIKKMPIGSVLGKDSFTITPTGAAAAGPLFLMEKMVRGWNPETSDWKYTMIMPNGTVFGRTKDKNAAGVGFCHECHVSGEDNDFMLLVPEENRL